MRTLQRRGEKNEDPFQQLLFSKIVPNCKKLGLLDANGGWLRKRFEEIGVIQFEDWADTGEEYDEFSIQSEDRRQPRSRQPADPSHEDAPGSDLLRGRGR